MVSTNVRIDSADIVALAAKLSNKDAAKAVARGLNDSIKQGRTVAKRSITDRYNIAAREVTGTGNKLIRISGARVGDLEARLFADAKRTVKISKFRGVVAQGLKLQRKQAKDANGQKKLVTFLKRGKTFVNRPTYANRTKEAVTVQIVKGKRTTLPSAFVAKMKSTGHVGIFGRSFNSYGYKGGSFNFRDQRKSGFKWGEADTPIAEMGVFTLHKAMANRFSERAIVSKMADALPNRVRFHLTHTLTKGRGAIVRP
jgi:hypothetical protein